MLGRLDDRERRILVSRYEIGGANELTLEQLGKELGITKERVRQIQSKAQNRLREFVRARRIFSRKITMLTPFFIDLLIGCLLLILAGWARDEIRGGRRDLDS